MLPVERTAAFHQNLLLSDIGSVAFQRRLELHSVILPACESLGLDFVLQLQGLACGDGRV